MEQEDTAWTRPPPSGAAVNPHISLTPGIQQQVTTFLTGLAPGETVEARHLAKKLHLPKKVVNQALYSLERSQRAFKQGDLPCLWSLHMQPPTNHQEHPNSRPASSDPRPRQSSEDTRPLNAAKTETVKAEERLNKGEAEDSDTDSTCSSTSCSDSSNPDQEAPRRSSDQSANRQLQLATATGQDLHSVPSTAIIMGEQKEQVMQYLLESGEATALVIAKNLGFKNAKQVSPTLYALEKQGHVTKNSNMTPPTWELSRHRRERMERSLKASQGNAPTAGKDTSITFQQHPRPLMQPRPFTDEDDTNGGQWASDDIPEFLPEIRRDPGDELLGRPGMVAVSLAAPLPSEHLGQAAGGVSEEPGQQAERERPVPGTELRVPAPGPVGTLARPAVPHAGGVVLDGRLFPVAEGTSKKVAKNAAAAATLRILVGENMKPGAGAEEGQDPAMEEVTNPTPENACVDTASASILLSEEQFLCSICLDVFTDPVSTPCGHNYCKTCITHYWDMSDVCQCPLCQTIFCKRPDILVNTLISEMADQFRKFKHCKQLNKTCSTNQEPAEPDEVSCDVL